MTESPAFREARRWRSETQRRLDLSNAVSGVELTDRDDEILDWLATWSPETTTAVADLIVRARTALQGPIR